MRPRKIEERCVALVVENPSEHWFGQMIMFNIILSALVLGLFL